jgi:hypothetical protein
VKNPKGEDSMAEATVTAVAGAIKPNETCAERKTASDSYA